MSIIIYWSPLHGQGQTSNLHVSAFIMSILHKKRVLMLQTHFSKNNLEGPLVGQNSGIHSYKNELFQDIGLDAAVTYSNINKLNLQTLESCCLTFHGTSLLLLPGSETNNRETFDRDIGKKIMKLIRDAEEFVDLVLIDANSGEDDLSFQLMSIADLIVINLTQRRHVLEKFIFDYGERFVYDRKVFYLFGDYDNNSVCNINNCRIKFRKYMNKANSGIIPYCTKYMDAQNESDIVGFLKDGLPVKEYSLREKSVRFLKRRITSHKYIPAETDYFFRYSRLTAVKMLALLHISTDANRLEGKKK